MRLLRLLIRCCVLEVRERLRVGSLTLARVVRSSDGGAGGGAGGTKKRNEDTPETLRKEEKHRTPLHNARRTTS